MNRQLNFYVDLNAPINTVSIAFNGLLKQGNSLTTFSDHYLIEPKKEFYKKDNNEIKLLNSYYFRFIKQMEINLTQLNDTQTRAYFSTQKASSIFSKVLSIIATLFLSSFLSFCFIEIMEMPRSDSLLFFIIFVVSCAIWSFIPILTFKNSSDKKHMQLFYKEFLPRIDSYIDIVKRNSSK